MREGITERMHLFLCAQCNFEEALGVLRPNVAGALWLIGSAAYETASDLRWQQNPVGDLKDLDFISQFVRPNLVLPDGWVQETNSFGNYKLSRKGLSIDLVPVDAIYSIKQRNLPETIENYLTGVPLTVQSIAYSVYQQTLRGEVGLAAIDRREVAVNSLEFALHRCAQLGITLRQMIEDKASKLNFTPVVPDGY